MKMVRNFHKLRQAIHFALLEDEDGFLVGSEHEHDGDEAEDKAGPRMPG